MKIKTAYYNLWVTNKVKVKGNFRTSNEYVLENSII